MASEPSTMNGITDERGAEAPEPVAETKTNSKRSEYRVFVATPATPFEGGGGEALEDGEWRSLGVFVVENNEGQRGARKQALDANPDLADRIHEGDPVYFFCAPQRSLHPIAAGLEQREPKLVI